jgi:cell division protein FtsB
MQMFIMKRVLVFLLVVIMLSIANAGSAQVRLIVDKAEKPAVATQIQGNKNDIKDALDNYFTKLGSNLKKSSGLYVAKNVSLPQLSTEKLDVYIKVDQLGKDKNNLSDVVMAVKPTSDVFVGDSSHQDIFALLPAYIQSFDGIVRDFVKQRTIDELNKKADKATKEKENLEKRAAKKEKEASKLTKEAKEVN